MTPDVSLCNHSLCHLWLLRTDWQQVKKARLSSRMILRGEQQHYISSVRACTAHLILRAACVGLGLALSSLKSAGAGRAGSTTRDSSAGLWSSFSWDLCYNQLWSWCWSLLITLCRTPAPGQWSQWPLKIRSTLSYDNSAQASHGHPYTCAWSDTGRHYHHKTDVSVNRCD